MMLLATPSNYKSRNFVSKMHGETQIDSPTDKCFVNNAAQRKGIRDVRELKAAADVMWHTESALLQRRAISVPKWRSLTHSLGDFNQLMASFQDSDSKIL